MRTSITGLGRRLAHSGPWLAVTGTFLLVGGLIWDVTIHDADPALASHENVFTIDNPAHVVFLTGIALIVVGMGIFLVDELASLRARGRRSRMAGVAALSVALLVVATAGASAAIGTQGAATGSALGGGGHVHGGTPGASGAPLAHHATFVTTGPGCAPQGTPPTSAQQAAADQLVAQVKAAWSPTLTETQATALGYRAPKAPTKTPTLTHFANPRLARDTTDLMDPAAPQALVFLNLPDGRTVLGGVLFTAPVGAGPCPGGSLTLWHFHQAGAQREMIHVWLFDNPAGSFSTGLGGRPGLLAAERELERP